MRFRHNARWKVVLWSALVGGGALLLSLLLDRESVDRPSNERLTRKGSIEARVLGFLEQTGWKPEGESVTVEKISRRLGETRATLLYRTHDGLSVPGVLFLVGRQHVLVGKLLDSGTGKDVTPELFGKAPVLLDSKRVKLDGAHKRGSDHPKVIMVEYGDYGCEACAKLEKVFPPLLDNHPEVQHVYKHYPLSEGSRYLAEVAEAVSLQGEEYFWEIHARFFAADKTGWDKDETERFVQAQLEEMELDPERIKEALKSGDPRKRVSRDQAELPVSETPTLVINGEVVVGALGYGEMRAIVEKKLKAGAR